MLRRKIKLALHVPVWESCVRGRLIEIAGRFLVVSSLNLAALAPPFFLPRKHAAVPPIPGRLALAAIFESLGLEKTQFRGYSTTMVNQFDSVPPGLAEALDDSLAEIAAGLFVPAEEVHRILHESIVRLERKALAAPPRA